MFSVVVLFGSAVVLCAVLWTAQSRGPRSEPPSRHTGRQVQGVAHSSPLAAPPSESGHLSRGPLTAREPVTPRLPRVQKILVVAYYRGGSSFAGEMFRQNPQATYWFEPLRALQVLTASRDYRLRHNTTLRLRSEAYLNTQLETVVKIFNCQFHDLDPELLKDQFLSKSRFGTFNFAKCVRKRKSVDYQTRFRACLARARAQCEETSVRVVKEIRLRLRDVTTLRDAGIRLLFSTRDPHAVLNSMGKKTAKSCSAHAVDWLCRRMDKDLTILSRNATGIVRLRYEDLVHNTEGSLKRVYGELGLNNTIPSRVTRWYTNNMYASKNNGELGTSRTNATRVARRWRWEMSDVCRERVDRQCESVLRGFGYGPQQNTDSV